MDRRDLRPPRFDDALAVRVLQRQERGRARPNDARRRDSRRDAAAALRLRAGQGAEQLSRARLDGGDSLRRRDRDAVRAWRECGVRPRADRRSVCARRAADHCNGRRHRAALRNDSVAAGRPGQRRLLLFLDGVSHLELQGRRRARAVVARHARRKSCSAPGLGGALADRSPRVLELSRELVQAARRRCAHFALCTGSRSPAAMWRSVSSGLRSRWASSPWRR